MSCCICSSCSRGGAARSRPGYESASGSGAQRNSVVVCDGTSHRCRRSSVAAMSSRTVGLEPDAIGRFALYGLLRRQDDRHKRTRLRGT
jgi:hypothetical protein